MESLSEQVDGVREAFFGMMFPAEQPVKFPEVEEVYPDHIIACIDDKYYSINYTVTDGRPTFAPREQWVEMEETYSVKSGFVNFGESVKATKLDDGNVKLAGYLIRYGDETKTDVTGDYFTKNTDFGKAVESEGWFNHRMPVMFNGKRVLYDEQLPDVKLTRDDVGIFAEIVLGARNEYEKIIADLGFAGKLGWSSGTAPHLVDRKQVGNANEITKWHLGLDASLTPTPAEPRNSVMPIKSLITPEASWQDTSDTEQNNKSTIKELEMETEIKNMLDGLKGELLQASKEAAESAVKSALEALPEVKSAVAITVTKDEGDKEFPSIAAQMAAVKAYEQSNGRNLHPRLKGLESLATKAALGLNEAVPSQGQFLLEPTLSSDFLKPIHEEGPFTSMANRLPVSANSNYGWINGIDETSRATGSRWGGVRGYWRAEASAVTASKPKFRRINWEIKAVEALMYVTEEQLNDAAMTDAIVRQSAIEEINFLANDAVLNGDGVGKPLGILNSGALVSVSRAATSAISHADILNMWQRMSARNRNNAVWFINSEAEPQLDQLTFTSGSTGILSPYVNYSATGVMQIKGRPVKVTEFNSALGTAGDILLADMSEYLFWEKGGVNTSVNPWLQWLTSEEAFKFTYRCDGQTSHYSPITPFKGSATQSAFVTLLATT